MRVRKLKKGVSENEAPGPVGAYTTTHNDTTTLMPNLIHRTEIRMAGAHFAAGVPAGCEHPETQSNTCTYGTKRNTYAHAYIRKDGKWRKRMQRGKSEKRKPPRARRKKYLTIENGRGGLDATPWTV